MEFDLRDLHDVFIGKFLHQRWDYLFFVFIFKSYHASYSVTSPQLIASPDLLAVFKNGMSYPGRLIAFRAYKHQVLICE